MLEAKGAFNGTKEYNGLIRTEFSVPMPYKKAGQIYSLLMILRLNNESLLILQTD